MFANLRTALHQKGISIKRYAEILGVTKKTVENKLSGISEFTYSEYKKTCTLLFEYNADYLFTKIEKDELLNLMNTMKLPITEGYQNE